MSENVEQNVEQNAPLRITISEVKSLLDQGKSRQEIAEHYGKTQAEMKRMVWGHPKLKNLKAKKQYTGIELEDDTEDVVAEESTTEAEVEVAQGPGPELNQAFENQEEMGIVAEEVIAPSETVNQDWN